MCIRQGINNDLNTYSNNLEIVSKMSYYILSFIGTLIIAAFCFL